jgi:hypothetical protein
MGSNHSHCSRTHGGAARQIDVSELQGQQVGGKSTFHHWFERLDHLPGKGRLDIATLDTKIGEVLWISILNGHNGAGTAPPPTVPRVAQPMPPNSNATAQLA